MRVPTSSSCGSWTSCAPGSRAEEVAAGKARAVIRETAEIASQYKQATDPEEITEISNAILEREAETLGLEVREIVNPDTGDALPVYDPQRAALATDFRLVDVPGRGWRCKACMLQRKPGGRRYPASPDGA